MPFAPDDFLGCIVATLVRRGRFDGLAVDDARTRALLSPRQLSVQHQHHVVQRAEQESAHEPPKPPIHGLPRREVVGQHAPAATRPNQVPQGVDHLPQVALPPPATHGRAWQQRLYCGPFDVRHVAGVTLGLAGQFRLAFSMFFFPHPAFTPHSRGIFKRALSRRRNLRRNRPPFCGRNRNPRCCHRRGGWKNRRRNARSRCRAAAWHSPADRRTPSGWRASRRWRTAAGGDRADGGGCLRHDRPTFMCGATRYWTACAPATALPTASGAGISRTRGGKNHGTRACTG